MTPDPVSDPGRDDLGVVLTGVTLAGMILAAASAYGDISAQVTAFGLTLVYIFGGLPSAARALHSLWFDLVLDIDLLMVVAAVAAAAVGATFEGAVLLTLFSLSGTLENQAMGKARRAVEALMALRPETALLRRDGTVAEVPVASLAAGDVVVIRPGSRMPVDGTILSGEGAINESTVTGESVPVVKGPGSSVFEATVNLDGVLDLRVDRSASESTVARMIQLVTQAQAAKAPSERFSSWFGQRYTAAVLAGSVIAFGVFLWLGWPQQDALYRAATLLVAASPCAIVISVPAAILSALSAAARGGVLFKGGAALETLGAVRSFAFDKTGTLTTGQAEVTGIVSLTGSEDAFLALIAGIEAQSEHHIASAIRRLIDRRGLTPASVTGVTAIPSEGIVGTDDIGPLWAGNRRLAARMGAALDDPDLLRLADGDQTVIYMGRGRQVLGAVAVADQTRASSHAGILALRKSGIRQIAIMTGDRRPVALRIGSALGLRDDEIHADLLPEDKVVLIADLAAGGKVAYVGDGVNDAAALARADVGIAMGAAGSDVALQAADVALLSENMERLAAAHLLAKRTGRIIRQNLVFAMGAMLVLVTGSLFFNLPLPLAVVGHEGGTVLVVLNGLRLLFDPIRSDRA
ncbi:MAG: cation-translocating P-type ATPase [Rhodobacter sp.]|nr:cation-translocating P-type ATPase [Rhodobacter sp.]MCA3494001.1 cation-translocating P-type ATPase [Rhodobacter sp.]MCA3501311.1 cation-translocating P-type ATPase [Rhodobacter sp.]MCA3504002.1 cation-translocating P-type ATPase [Rhodobacter sp.]MCA3517177.1 cation-translocating P-type ATPase [Rhodobacter sp.]